MTEQTKRYIRVIENTCECGLCENVRGVQMDDPTYKLMPACLHCDDGTCMNSCACYHGDECLDDCEIDHTSEDEDEE
jgi:hypothetical protein